jgi:outer membrane protein assembly factor BamA
VNRLCPYIILIFLVLSAPEKTLAMDQPKQVFQINAIVQNGNERSRKDWLEEYLGLHPPFELRSSDLFAIRRKLLTTSVFRRVDVSVREIQNSSGTYELVLDLEEKWTTIPVIRGQFGGGTLLQVIGGYDIHGFGRLWTVGAESRRYGSAPLGYVLWAQAPRWKQGKHVLGFEYWKEYRQRNVYDQNLKKIGLLNTNKIRGRTIFMLPWGDSPTLGDSNHWQWGLDVTVVDELPAQYLPETEGNPMPGVRLPEIPEVELTFLPSLVYDNINVNHYDYDGLRFLTRAGFGLAQGQTSGKAIGELYYYWLLEQKFNLAFHAFASHANGDHLSAQTFLGGLDSLRGLPDSAIYGSKAVYTNLEFREISLRFKHLWLQNVVFVDWGSAADRWNLLEEHQRLSSGVGVRLGLPSVHRLMLRIDVAWDVQNPRGGAVFSAGLNQLFSPFSPL